MNGELHPAIAIRKAMGPVIEKMFVDTRSHSSGVVAARGVKAWVLTAGDRSNCQFEFILEGRRVSNAVDPKGARKVEMYFHRSLQDLIAAVGG